MPADIIKASCIAMRNLSESASPTLVITGLLRSRNTSITTSRTSATDLPDLMKSSTPSTLKSRHKLVIVDTRSRSAAINFLASSALKPLTPDSGTSGTTCGTFCSVPFAFASPFIGSSSLSSTLLPTPTLESAGTDTILISKGSQYVITYAGPVNRPLELLESESINSSYRPMPYPTLTPCSVPLSTF